MAVSPGRRGGWSLETDWLKTVQDATGRRLQRAYFAIGSCGVAPPGRSEEDILGRNQAGGLPASDGSPDRCHRSRKSCRRGSKPSSFRSKRLPPPCSPRPLSPSQFRNFSLFRSHSAALSRRRRPPPVAENQKLRWKKALSVELIKVPESCSLNSTWAFFRVPGVEFIDENGGGPGVRLRKRQRKGG